MNNTNENTQNLSEASLVPLFLADQLPAAESGVGGVQVPKEKHQCDRQKHDKQKLAKQQCAKQPLGVYYLAGHTNIGVVAVGKQALIIDTGVDKKTGKKILMALDAHNLKISVIINTHSHADHCGGNHYLKAKTGASVIAPSLEADIMEHTFLEPFMMFSGAYPPDKLLNKFLMAKPVQVDRVVEGGEIVDFNGLQIKMVSLPGHSLNHMGVLVNGIMFCGDAYFSSSICKKHIIPFFCNIADTKKTLGYLPDLQVAEKIACWVPAHGGPSQSVAQEARENLHYIRTIEDIITAMIAEDPGGALSEEQILQGVFEKTGIHETTATQYILYRTAICAYLGSLYNEKKIAITMAGGIMRWSAC